MAPQMIRTVTNRRAMLKHDTQNPQRVLGLGNCADKSGVMAMFKGALCAVYALPTIAKVQWEFAGPITHAQTLKTLGASIDILGSGDTPDGVDAVYSTPGLINGEFQTFIMACAVGVHLEVSPYMALIRGNAFARPASGVTTAKPFSPDAWTVNDQTNSWGGGVTPPSARAYLIYGEPAAEAYWAMVRAYNLRWTYGSLINILDEQLRETAYMPPNAQEGSASSSEIDALRMAREVNNRYSSLGATLDFSLIDTTRVGSVGNAPNAGRFAPNNDLQYVGVTYGGSDLRGKIGIGQNSEFRSLTNPYILKPGVPPGLTFEEQNQELGDYFRAQFDITEGVAGLATGLTPAQMTESGDWVTTAGSAFTERTIDGLDVAQTVIGASAIYKGFRALMSNEIKGWEMTESLASQIRDNSDLAAALCAECGVLVGWAG
jgi:hypothetical protein